MTTNLYTTFKGLKKAKIGATSIKRQRVKRALEKRNKRSSSIFLPNVDWNSSGDLEFLKSETYCVPQGLWKCDDLEGVIRLVKKQNKILCKKALKAIAHKSLPENLKTELTAIFTQPAFAGDINVIDPMLSETALRQTYTHLIALSNSADVEFSFVTFIDGRFETSDYQTLLDVAGQQRLFRSILSKMADNFIAFSEVALFNSHTHESGGRIISFHVHALIWGPNVVARARMVQAQVQKRLTRSFSNAEPVNVKKVSSDPLNLARLLGYLMKPPHQCATFYPGKDGKPGNTHHSEKNDRYVRYLRLAQLRSLLRWDEIMFAGGQGAAIRKHVIATQRVTVAGQIAMKICMIHRDALLHWWSDFYAASKLDRYKLPFIKTRA